jgi:hypothetical protein
VTPSPPGYVTVSLIMCARYRAITNDRDYGW